MGDVVANISKGNLVNYANLPGATDSLIAVLLKSSGLEADATLVDYDDLAALLAAANDECDFTNYARQTITAIVVTVDDTNNRVDIDCGDITFTNAGGATNNAIGKLVLCYKPASGSADSAIIPMTFHDYVETTTGSTLQLQIAAAGFARAA
jgi:hypothetical protein